MEMSGPIIEFMVGWYGKRNGWRDWWECSSNIFIFQIGHMILFLLLEFTLWQCVHSCPWTNVAIMYLLKMPIPDSTILSHGQIWLRLESSYDFQTHASMWTPTDSLQRYYFQLQQPYPRTN